MKMLKRYQRCSDCRTGFSLFETAIVLGMVGMVLAGIWAASLAVGKDAKLNQATDELNAITINMRELYSGQNVSYINLYAVHNFLSSTINSTTEPAAVSSGAPSSTDDFCFYSPILAGQKVFPQEMLLSGNPVAGNPWDKKSSFSCGGGNSAGSAQITLTGSSGIPVQFIVRYVNVPYDMCVKLLMRTSQVGPDTNLNRIAVTRFDTNQTTTYKPGTTTCAVASNCPLPPSGADAVTGCPAAGTFAIDWQYQLGP